MLKVKEAMKKTTLTLFAALLALPSSAFAAPDASAYKRITGNRAITLTNCSVDGVEGALSLRVSLSADKALVTLPSSLKRSATPVGPKGTKFVACGVSDSDPTKAVLFVKKNVTATPTEASLALSSFKEAGSVGSACSSVQPWPKNFIYKTIGSHHFTDIRRNTIGLIMTFGASVPKPQCIDVISKNGTKVGDFGFYSAGAGWYARYYGGVGCGDAINGQALASRARKAAGDDTIYARIGSVCYGPIAASKCVGSKAC
jgi:hypothetical protein